MELNVHKKEKYVSIWLTRAESADAGLRESLKSLYTEYRQQNYRVVVFDSGSADLTTLTKDLLAHNLEVRARKTE